MSAPLTPQQAADAAHAGWCAARDGAFPGDCPHPWGAAERAAWITGFCAWHGVAAPAGQSSDPDAGDLATLADSIGAFA